jgi:hypothetical protein
MSWSARGNVLNPYLRNTSIGTTVIGYLRKKYLISVKRHNWWLFINFIKTDQLTHVLKDQSHNLFREISATVYKAFDFE